MACYTKNSPGAKLSHAVMIPSLYRLLIFDEVNTFSVSSGRDCASGGECAVWLWTGLVRYLGLCKHINTHNNVMTIVVIHLPYWNPFTECAQPEIMMVDVNVRRDYWVALVGCLGLSKHIHIPSRWDGCITYPSLMRNPFTMCRHYVGREKWAMPLFQTLSSLAWFQQIQ